ncbi:MAG: hypothetical protein AAGJ93_08405 [Bacteroidota bacterium]
MRKWLRWWFCSNALNYFLAYSSRVLLINEPTNDIFAFEDIAPFSLGYELAIGFNTHASDFVKIIGRFAYTHYGLVDSRIQQFKQLNNTYLTFNLGLQYAFYNKR